jgi:hypothetical protein
LGIAEERHGQRDHDAENADESHHFKQAEA